jgi:murein DD-endopeptidase MepM/ murein hydrolase activator NlpD
MRNRVSAYRSRFLGQAALVAVLAATAAGCSESSRFGTPLFTGSTDNQRDIIGNNQPMPPAVTPGAVYSSNLPPAGAATAYSAEPSSGSSLPPGDYVWTPDGVRPNGAGSAAPTTVSYSQPNYAQPTYAQPSYTPPQAPAQQAAGGSYVVSSGDTLYSIGRRHGVSANEIAAANGLSSPENIRVGQRLQIPGAGSTQIASSAPSATPSYSGSSASSGGYLKAPSAPSQPAPKQTASAEPRIIPGVPSIPVEGKSKPPVQQASTSAAVDDMIEPPSANGTTFRWPVRGRIISGYGAKPNGQRNDGINLAVPEGTTVKAAEAGTVIYAGNELEGYGKLVLIRHNDDWVSAYAHNSDITVKRGDTVRRGQTVATAGMSGSVTSPQVHFELRKKAKPVNPLDYLAGA